MKLEHDSKSEYRRNIPTDDRDELLNDPIITLEHTDKFFRIMHTQSTCMGEYCTIHNRSNHSMRSFSQSWRGDKALMERICTHGVGHPDPDEINLNINSRGVHACDGCCEGAYDEDNN